MPMRMYRREFLQRTVGGAALLASGGLLQACGTTDEAAQEGSGPTSTPSPEDVVTLTAAGSGVGFGFLHISLERWLEDEPVELETREMGFADAQLAAIHGTVEVVEVTLMAVINARMEDVGRLRLFAPTFSGHNSLLTTPDGPDTISELEGARLGTLARGSEAYMALRIMAGMEGLDIEEDFELTIGDASVLEGLFREGELDAFTLFEPGVTRVLHAGEMKEILRYHDAWIERMGVRLPPFSLGAQEEWVDEHPDIVSILADASRKNMESFMAGSDRFHEHKEQFGLETDAEVELLAERMAPLYAPKWTDELIEAAGIFIDAAIEYGVTTEEARQVDLEEVILGFEQS